jgi:transcriptional regulator with XRE-family HTH domain
VTESPQIAASAPSAPTVLRIILGKRLKELREERGISFADAAKALSVTALTVRRMENAQVSFKIPYVRELLRLYDADRQETDEFIGMADRANEPGWWHSFRQSVPSWFRAYVSLETAASVLRVYEPHYVTGLLQTPDYARAVIRAGFPHDDDAGIDHRVELRLRRQELLHGPDSPTLWVVLEESSLLRNVGGRRVMRAQLDHIIETAQLPHVTLRIVPLGAGAHAGTGGHFTYFRFAEKELQDIVYAEVGLTSAVYFDQHSDVVSHLEAHIRTSRLASLRVPDPVLRLHSLRQRLDE